MCVRERHRVCGSVVAVDHINATNRRLQIFFGAIACDQRMAPAEEKDLCRLILKSR